MSTNIDPKLSEALKTMKSKISSIREQIRVLDDHRNDGWSERSNSEKDDLEFDLNQMRASTEELLNISPEGTLEGDEVNYFLAVAEILKMNESLRQQLTLTKKNISGTSAEIEAATAWLEDLEVINKIIMDKYRRTDEKNQSPDVQKESERSVLDNKIRSTRVLYRQFKSYLADYLKREDESDKENDSCMPMLLQALYDKFQSSENDSEIYLDLSHVECDVKQDDVIRLIEFGIVEQHPTEPEKLRLTDFTK